MLLLHISDIHFQHPLCDTNMDPNRPFRTELVRDVRSRCASLGKNVDALLVTGDIAYAAKQEEYQAAHKWLLEVAEASACTLERLFVVPGNHDVNRQANAQRAAIQNVHHAILSKTKAEDLERQFLRQFNDPDAGHALFASLEAYNLFAAPFSCNVYPKEKLFWVQDIELEHTVKLRLFGLTSTLLSGVDGQDDKPRHNLFLSPFQTQLDPEDNVVNAVLSHHPPDWFLDADDIEDAVKSRATLHFFGHRHRQRCDCNTNYIRFSAAAVNPDRHEAGWEPGYNLIDIHVARYGAEYCLEVVAHVFVWQTDPNGFRPKRFKDADYQIHKLPIRTRQLASVAVTETAHEGESSPMEAGTAVVNEIVNLEATMSDEHTRNIVLRFWKLRASERREVATTLDLIEASEIALPEAERYDRALRRASEIGLLDQLVEEVTKREAR